jgi:HD-GYP domain-containing protein (c-di-GMP phosphodiesterase class II)
MTARELGLSTQTVQRIELAGTLHDVGKVDVDDTILRKPGPLTAQEWAEVRRHPEIGARLLRGAKLVDIADWVLAHHERVDGSGYPNGSDDREIPIEAKILSVCDAHDAMRTRRVYQAPMTPDHAVAELQRTAGTQFDEGVVTAFLRALDRSGGRSPLRSATTTVGYQASMKRPAVP